MAVHDRPEASPAEAEPTVEESRGRDELPLDVVFETLSNRRRRLMLRYLLSGSGDSTLGELAEHVASVENEKPVAELTSSERKRVYICLYQSHLPMMDGAGVIDFDQDRKTVELDENVEPLTRYLPEVDDAGTDEEGLTATVAGWARDVDRRLRTLASG